MNHLTKLLNECERGTIDRRQLLQALGLTATAAFAFGVLPRSVAAFAEPAQAAGANKAFPVTTFNHVSIGTPDYVRSRNFYIDLFEGRDVWDDGKKCQVDFGNVAAPNSLYIVQGKPDAKAAVSHYAFGVPGFWAKRTAIKAELDRRGLPGVKPDGEGGWMVNGPSGYMVQPVTVRDPAMFPGAAQPCEVAKSAKCKDGYEAGLKDAAAAPKPGGKGFKAMGFHRVILHVPDVAKERDFYTSLLGMKVVSDKPDDCTLRFGRNTLVLRPAAGDGKPYCHEFGFAVVNYDSAAAKAELERRGLNPKPGSTKGAWSFSDPDGLAIEVARPAEALSASGRDACAADCGCGVWRVASHRPRRRSRDSSIPSPRPAR